MCRTTCRFYITGKVSARDEKEPQLIADVIRPLSDLDPMEGEHRPVEQSLYVRFAGEDDPAYERLKKRIDHVYPGRDKMICYFNDTKKKLGTSCVIHKALIEELEGLLGTDNVILK